jgi:hypothetical protein
MTLKQRTQIWAALFDAQTEWKWQIENAEKSGPGAIMKRLAEHHLARVEAAMATLDSLPFTYTDADIAELAKVEVSA